MKKLVSFLALELLFVICLSIFTYVDWIYAVILIIIFSPMLLVILLLVMDDKKGIKGSRITLFSIIFYFFVQINVFSMIADDYIWSAPIIFPNAVESDGGVLSLIVIVAMGLLAALIISYELIAMHERNSEKRRIENDNK